MNLLAVYLAGAYISSAIAVYLFGRWSAWDEERSFISGILWPLILVMLIVYAPFYLVGRAGDFLENSRSR